MTRREGGVSAREIQRFFRDTPGIRTSKRSTRDLLDDAAGLFQVIGLRSFAGMSAWTLPVVPGQPPVKLLLLGEFHSNPHSGANLMRYVMGQVALEGKCIDLYLEAGFDWRPIRRRRQVGGNALSHISRHYPDVPGLRVHHIDVRDTFHSGREDARVEVAGLADHREMIKRMSYAWYNSDPYSARYLSYAPPRTKARLVRHDLFRVTPSEYFAMVTGFTGASRPGDRTVAQLTAQYAADRAGGGAMASRFHTAALFRSRRRRYDKQRARFLRTTGMDGADLDGRIRAWAGPLMGSFFRAYCATMDLFAFYRMFGTFVPRGDGTDKPGCPMEQRNVVYVSGDLHAHDNVMRLLTLVFERTPDVARGTHSGMIDEQIAAIDDDVVARDPTNVGISAADRAAAARHVNATPALTVF